MESVFDTTAPFLSSPAGCDAFLSACDFELTALSSVKVAESEAKTESHEIACQYLYVRTYVGTYNVIRTYVRRCVTVRRYVRMYVRAYVRTYVRTYVCTYKRPLRA